MRGGKSWVVNQTNAYAIFRAVGVYIPCWSDGHTKAYLVAVFLADIIHFLDRVYSVSSTDSLTAPDVDVVGFFSADLQGIGLYKFTYPGHSSLSMSLILLFTAGLASLRARR